MWNKYLQEEIDKLVTTLHELSPEYRSGVISLVQDKLFTHMTSEHTRTLMHPMHEWLLPPVNIQRAPYIPPPEQRVEQRVNTANEQRVERFTKLPVLTRITNAPPIMAVPNPTQKRTLKLTKWTHSKSGQRTLQCSTYHTHSLALSCPCSHAKSSNSALAISLYGHPHCCAWSNANPTNALHPSQRGVAKQKHYTKGGYKCYKFSYQMRVG